MSSQKLSLPPGRHELDGLVRAARVESQDRQRGRAKLALSVKPSPTEGSEAAPHDVSLVLCLGRAAAVKLLLALYDLERAMGWQFPHRPGQDASGN